MTKISTKSRKIIRNAAVSRGAKYKITANGEVHFYGELPNTNSIGWYFVAWTADDLIAAIDRGQF